MEGLGRFASRRWLLVASVLGLALVAGCLGSPDTAGEEEIDTASAENASSDGEIEHRELYSFEGPVNGTAPPNPAGPGAAPGGEPARTDTFEVPANATRLRIDVAVQTGSGVADVSIVDPSGDTIYETRMYAYAGLVCGDTVGVSPGEETRPQTPPEPGTYEVRYHVAGSVCFEASLGVTLAS